MKWKKEIIGGKPQYSLLVVESETQFEYVMEFHYNDLVYGMSAHYTHPENRFHYQKSGKVQKHGRWN
jgi:hypothetical protein